MSGRIDHAAEARKRIVWGEEWMEREGDTDVTNTVVALHAQVHATLALAEQQRIANLIALSESGRTTVNGARAALSALYVGAVEDGTAHMQLRPDIAAALGIGDDDE